MQSLICSRCDRNIYEVEGNTVWIKGGVVLEKVGDTIVLKRCGHCGAEYPNREVPPLPPTRIEGYATQ